MVGTPSNRFGTVPAARRLDVRSLSSLKDKLIRISLTEELASQRVVDESLDNVSLAADRLSSSDTASDKLSMHLTAAENPPSG